MIKAHSPLFDRVAILLSGLCLVHCLLGALLLSTMAIAGGMLGHEVHIIGLALALPLAFVALWRGLRIHGQLGVLGLGVAGLGLMAASLFADHAAAQEIWFSVSGAVILAGAHIWNLKAVRS